MSTSEHARIVVIAGNVETLIEDPARLPSWTTAVAKEILEQRPAFAAVHLQGLGTKNRGGSILQQLIKELDNQPDIEDFDFSREFHDLDNLGLCSFYYFKRETEPALYNFQKKEYSPIDGHRSEDAARSNQHIQFGRLTQEHEPAAFMETKWKIFGRPFTFVNLNLSPEKSPLDGVKNYPTESVHKRRSEFKTIVESVAKTSSDDCDLVVYAGNFNCQIDKEKMMQDHLHHNHAANHEETDGSGRVTKVEGIDINGRKLYTIDSGNFDFFDLHEWVFGTCKGRLIRKYDTELPDSLKDTGIFEPNIYFPPTAPYEFDHDKDVDVFSKTSAPAWKSRIVSNRKLWDIMHKDSFSSSSVYYGLIGVKDNIGENKPVSLITTLSIH